MLRIPLIFKELYPVRRNNGVITQEDFYAEKKELLINKAFLKNRSVKIFTEHLTNHFHSAILLKRVAFSRQ